MKDQYEWVIDVIPVPIICVDKNNDLIIDANKAFSRQYFSENILLSQKFKRFFNPIYFDLQIDCKNDDKIQYFTLKKPDGSNVLVEIVENQLINEDETIRIIAVNRLFPDITKLDALNHPLFKSIFDKARDIILVADNNGNFIQVNDTACRILGYSRDEFHKLNVIDITHKPMRSYGRKKWEDFIETGTDEGEYQLISKSGEIIFTEYRAVANIQPGKHLSILRDITREKALNKLENKFKKIVDSAPDAIMLIGVDGNIEYCNKKACGLFGYKDCELKGMSVEDLVPEEIRNVHQNYRQEYQNKPEMRPMGTGYNFNAIKKNGKQIPVDIMLGPFDLGKSSGTLAIIRDISSFKEGQLKLKKEKEFSRLLYDLTIISNQSESTDEALKKSIFSICEFMSWPVGHVYLKSEKGLDDYYPANIWHISDPDKFSAFRELTLATDFKLGEGMVGNIALTGKPEWIFNAHQHTGFKRRFPGLDLQIRAAFGLPILIKDNVVGVLEFFSEKVQESDKELLNKLSAIGHQLGRVIERNQTHYKLLESEVKYRTLFETSDDAILILKNGIVYDCNEGVEQLFNLPEDKLVGSSFNQLLLESKISKNKDYHLVIKNLERANAGIKSNFEWKVVKDGEVIYTEVDMIPIELKDKDFLQIKIHDISKRKQTEILIKRNAKLFVQLFDNSPVGVVMLNKDGVAEKVNQSFENIFGYSSEEIIGKKLDEVISPIDSYDNANSLTDLTFKGQSFQVESVRVHKNGKEIPVLIGGTPVEIDNQIIAIFGIYVDISDRKKAEEKLKVSLKEKNVLLQEVHHRVKNNLAIISGLLEMQASSNNQAEVTEAFKDAQARIKSMALVHEQLYQVELFSSLQFDNYLHKLSSKIHKTFYPRDKEIELNINCESVELTLNQAIPCGLLLNELLTNAYKHAFKGREKGEITLSLKFNQYLNQVNIEVKDNGIGLPENYEDKIFRSLGFTLIKTLVKQLKADFNIKSGNGTSFEVIFQLSK